MSLVSFTLQYPSLISVYLITSSQHVSPVRISPEHSLSDSACVPAAARLPIFRFLKHAASVTFTGNSTDTLYSAMLIPSRLVHMSEIRRDLI